MSETLFDSLPPEATKGQWFTAHCDGGSRGNPGPAGFGAVIQDPAGHVIARLSQFLGKQTNNFAEYSGLLAVLEWALGNGASRLQVVSDSELMVKQMKGIYKVNHPALRPLWEEARRRAARLDGFEITHTLRGGNKEADRLANEAMDQGMGKRKDEPGGQSSESSSHQINSKSPAAKTTRQVLEGFVKNGVVHLLEGELPDGIFVKVIRE